ncbi:MAG: RidA family protein [Bosea sp. (in: a-proteobacteria)]|uniref:RidA family protein n=1 Tax=Bosea sp. (in: a-proteobacteria) TaxID=1871050 RepID=UPI003F7B7387
MVERHEVTGRLSKVLVANGFAFLSGLTAADRSGGVREQTTDTLRQIDGYLAAVGSDKTRIVVANIWLKDIASFGEMNVAWDAWVDRDRPPARATVESRLAAENILVEIQVQALV